MHNMTNYISSKQENNQHYRRNFTLHRVVTEGVAGVLWDCAGRSYCNSKDEMPGLSVRISIETVQGRIQLWSD